MSGDGQETARVFIKESGWHCSQHGFLRSVYLRSDGELVPLCPRCQIRVAVEA